MTVVMNACGGSRECGKRRVFPTFPHALSLFFWREFIEKFTMERGEGNVSTSHLPVDAFLKVLSSINLTIHKE